MSPPQDKPPGKGGSSDFGSDGDRPRRTATGGVQLPAVAATKSTASLPQVGDKPKAPTGQVPAQHAPPPGAPGAARPPNALTQHQKQIMGSGFQDTSRERRIAGMLGGPARGGLRETGEIPVPVITDFDGETPAPEVTGRDVWKATNPPATSDATNRGVDLLDQVIKQFGVGTNPRYEPDAPGKSRGHLFVWDVSRAMGCEIPHFVGPRELTLAQTVDWLRHEGPMRGWTKVGEYDVFEVLATGQLVVAVPRDVKVKAIGVVPPQDDAGGPEGKPLLTGAGLVRGHLKPMMELFGVRQLEYFTHA